MNSPIETFESLRDFYITYLETAFRIEHPEIQKARRDLLEREGTLCADLYLEPLPKFADYGLLISDLRGDLAGKKWLPNFSETERAAFVDLCLGGLLPRDATNPNDGSLKLYTHQLEMLQKGVCPANPGIVTSGTGSGKTESFLLPILAQIAKEATKWPKSQKLRTWEPWWKVQQSISTPTFMRDAGNEASSRPKAVRALILYPMNALVEDQLVRMRKALDSDEAHFAMDKHFGGNRIFFGRYTSATKVTGWLKHPRLNDAKARQRAAGKVSELRDYLASLEKTYCAAVEQGFSEGLQYNFPRVPGSEAVSRWDMQRHAPDILITNTSMLSTMLVREVDEPIFAQTKAWIESDPDAYFYLVLDELHLQRGSSGTEVSYLIKQLLTTLGLTKVEHRHKLRILSSSASLPVDGEFRKQSIEYLWGMFGDAGLPLGAKQDDWASCIVKGSSVSRKKVPFAGDCLRLLQCIQELQKLDDPNPKNKHALTAWTNVNVALGGSDAMKSDEETALSVLIAAAELLEDGCSLGNSSPRATSVHMIGKNLFGGNPLAIELIKALVWVRSCSDNWKSWFGQALPFDVSIPRFRAHTFLRAIEGLFVSPYPAPLELDRDERAKRLFSDLTVDSGLRYGNKEINGRSTRRVDLLYCECCGVLLYGGKRSSPVTTGGHVELLPNDPDTQSLPERAKAAIIEQRSAADYSLFMPTLDRFWPVGKEPVTEDESQGVWREAEFNPFTATIKGVKPGGKLSIDTVPGWEYFVSPANFKPSKEWSHDALDSPGTALPFQCPACGTSYKSRRGMGKHSPIRGFRVGFAKTTQLLASTLMGELQKTNPSERLVTFSDSRQDAAKAAYDLESGHHDDIRLEIVVRELNRMRQAKLSPEEIDAQLKVVNARIRELDDKDASQTISDEENRELTLLEERKKGLRLSKGSPSVDSIALREILEPPRPSGGASLHGVLASLVHAGIHPTDGTGLAPLPKPTRGPRDTLTFAWQQLFSQGVNGKWCWRSSNAYEDHLMLAREEISADLEKLVGHTIFRKTYFAVEEAGWGYPCLPLFSGKTRQEIAVFDSMLRALGDVNRLNPSLYSGNDTPWTTSHDVPPRNRFRRFAVAKSALFGGDPNALIDSFLSAMELVGHQGGRIWISALHFNPVGADSPYWRCKNCGRIHLHIGAGLCTRCYEPIPTQSSGLAGELREANFLGKRIGMSSGVRRMRSEELTGMTTNPAARLRRFKGILIADDDDILPSGLDGFDPDATLDRKARVVDVLSVTTTMEVGVDIGDLRAIFQANMPPQRFNYQQRVGRAGRRGQAFSFVLTVCRSKSHDLHYFRNPEQITGDQPPPPFLTTSLEMIAQRLVRKTWLVAAFRLLRRQAAVAGQVWPVDLARGKPDNHGEFFTIEFLLNNKTTWLPLIRSALDMTAGDRNSFAQVCAQGDDSQASAILKPLTTDALISDIDLVLADGSMIDKGLAEALAEHGMFPMYGMPTRVRLLQTRPIEARDGKNVEFAAMDRDIDVAIQEFAPGRFLVQDKRRYFTAGYAGSLVRRRDRPDNFDSYPDDIGELRLMTQCPVCEAWTTVSTSQDECKACGSEMSQSKAHRCFVPRGFITTLVAKRPDDDGEEARSKANRTSIAEARVVTASTIEGTNLGIDLNRQAWVHRLNRGEYADEEWKGFDALKGTLQVPFRSHGQTRRLWTNGVWIDREAHELDVGESPIKGRFREAGQVENSFYLAAPKVTDSIALTIAGIPKGLQLFRASSGGSQTPILSAGFRAGALSASFLIVNYASRVLLDIDPDEIEILEPRVQRLKDGKLVPILQMADQLVNGSGLCDRLSQTSVSGEPIVLKVMRDILANRSTSPLKELLEPDHKEKCLLGCYRCLHRYGNQAYHGLLDWRLGLDVIQLMLDNTYDAGLSGDFSSPGVEDWKNNAQKLADEAASLFGTSSFMAGNIPLIGIGKERWAAVVHPFWDKDGEKLFDENPPLEALAVSEGPLEWTTTFELSRTMGEVMLRLRSSGTGP